MSSMQCGCPSAPTGPTLAATCGGSAFMLFMGLLEVFIRSQCDLEDPCGRMRARRRLDDAYDFIVVGGGSAGAVVAARLSEVPHFTVLLIEAGLDEPTGAQVPSMFLNFIGSSIDWSYNTEPEDFACLNNPERRCNWPRGKVLGGTSTMNGMMYMRGSRADFDGWASRGNSGWTYEEVLPFFIKSEDNLQPGVADSGFHGQGGPLTVTQFPYHPPLSHAFVQAARELGHAVRDLNGARHSGFAIAQTTTRNGSRLSSARAFLRPARARPNLHVLLNATATRVLLNTTARRAVGVEVRRGDSGDTVVVHARNEVIVCAGAVATPQLLLLSGIGPQDELRAAGVAPLHHLPGVGRNLHNHVGHVLNFFIDDPDTQPLNWATAMEYLLFRDGLMSGTGVSEVTGFIHSRFADPAQDDPDIQFFFGGFLANCARTGQPRRPAPALCRPLRAAAHLRQIPLAPRGRGDGGGRHPLRAAPGRDARPAPLRLPPGPHARQGLREHHVRLRRLLGVRRAPGHHAREPPGGLVPHGARGRPGRLRRPRPARAGPGRAARGGRQRHARRHLQQHQRAHHHDRREGRRPHQAALAAAPPRLGPGVVLNCAVRCERGTPFGNIVNRLNF